MKMYGVIEVVSVDNGYVVTLNEGSPAACIHVYNTIEQVLQVVLDYEKGAGYHVCVVEHGDNDCILSDGSVCPMASSSHIKACRGCLKHYDHDQPAQELVDEVRYVEQPADEVIIGPHNLHEAINSADIALSELRDSYVGIKRKACQDAAPVTNGIAAVYKYKCWMCGVITKVPVSQSVLDLLYAVDVRAGEDGIARGKCDKCIKDTQ